MFHVLGGEGGGGRVRGYAHSFRFAGGGGQSRFLPCQTWQGKVVQVSGWQDITSAQRFNQKMFFHVSRCPDATFPAQHASLRICSLSFSETSRCQDATCMMQGALFGRRCLSRCLAVTSRMQHFSAPRQLIRSSSYIPLSGAQTSPEMCEPQAQTQSMATKPYAKVGTSHVVVATILAVAVAAVVSAAAAAVVAEVAVVIVEFAVAVTAEAVAAALPAAVAVAIAH